MCKKKGLISFFFTMACITTFMLIVILVSNSNIFVLLGIFITLIFMFPVNHITGNTLMISSTIMWIIYLGISLLFIDLLVKTYS